jgi:hypothetical protein
MIRQIYNGLTGPGAQASVENLARLEHTRAFLGELIARRESKGGFSTVDAGPPCMAGVP